MNQKTSPDVTESSLPSTSDGTLPVPFPSFPWHERQLRAYNCFPASTAAGWPSYGFLVARADAGASWNFVSTSAASASAGGSRIAAAMMAYRLINKRINPPQVGFSRRFYPETLHIRAVHLDRALSWPVPCHL